MPLSLLRTPCIAMGPAVIATTLIVTLAGAATTPDSTIAFPAPRDRHWQTGPARRDRLQHGSLSFTLSALARVGGASRAQAFALTLALGAAKECLDARTTTFDLVDFSADAAGSALGASVPGARRR